MDEIDCFHRFHFLKIRFTYYHFWHQFVNHIMWLLHRLDSVLWKSDRYLDLHKTFIRVEKVIFVVIILMSCDDYGWTQFSFHTVFEEQTDWSVWMKTGLYNKKEKLDWKQGRTAGGWSHLSLSLSKFNLSKGFHANGRKQKSVWTYEKAFVAGKYWGDLWSMGVMVVKCLKVVCWER